MSVKVMAHVWDLQIGDPTAKAVLLAYVDHADHDGNNIYPSVPTIAKKTEYSERTVQRATSKLEEMGLLIPAGTSDWRTNRWRFNWNWQPPEEMVTESHHQGCQSVTDQGDRESPKPSFDPSSKPSSAPSADEPLPESRAVTDPVTNDVYYKDANQNGYGRYKTWLLGCPECSTEILFDKLGTVQECRGCGREYRLVKTRPKQVATDPAMAYLFARANSGTVYRKFHGFSNEEKEIWQTAVAIAGIAAAKEWVDVGFEQEEKRGADLAYWVYGCLVKYQRAPLKATKKQEEELTEAMLGLNV